MLLRSSTPSMITVTYMSSYSHGEGTHGSGDIVTMTCSSTYTNECSDFGCIMPMTQTHKTLENCDPGERLL